jgi:hypothetical protein
MGSNERKMKTDIAGMHEYKLVVHCSRSGSSIGGINTRAIAGNMARRMVQVVNAARSSLLRALTLQIRKCSKHAFEAGGSPC